MLVGLSLLGVCLAMSEKLNLGALPNNGWPPGPPNENVDDVFVVVVGAVDVAPGVENWNPPEGVGVPVGLPKPGKENPLLLLFVGFIDALLPNTEPLELPIGVVLPKIDVPELPLKLPKIDGLLSYCDVAFGAGDGDSVNGFSSFDVCFWICGWDFSGFVNENLTFSLELNGVLGPDPVEGVCGAKNNQSSIIRKSSNINLPDALPSFLVVSGCFFVAVLSKQKYRILI